ncbi:MAG: glycoside hydrolase family 3 C-terminal domain-containing protein [Faecousia sp.]
METEKKNTVNVKEYKKQGKAQAEAYLKRKKESKSAQERKAVVREQKQKIKDWKGTLKALAKPERKAQKKAHKAYKRRLHRVRTIVIWAAVVLILALVVNALSPIIHNVSAILSLKYSDQTPEAEAARQAGLEFAPQISDEGIVLLKNEHDLLPLKNKKVNIFGDDAYSFKYSGGGSGAVDLSNCVTFFQGLELAGIQYNPELHKLYAGMGNNAEDTGSNNIVSMLSSFLFGAKTEDTHSNDYLTEEVLSQAKAYSDQAIVVLSNDAVESSDCSLEALALTPNRQELIRTVAENFDHVIVIVNVGNASELGIVDAYDSIEAVVWTGIPGTQGCVSLGKVLTGEVNPSGRLVDTYAYSVSSAPASVNFGDYPYDNINGKAFINYEEGIYVGYRYYETRYAGDEAGYWKAVQYPFGYGLSYTDFDWETLRFAVEDGMVTWEVKVTNTGSVPGKDVVQLYFSAPYIPGGIEKSAIELADYGKTRLLQPGESESLTLSFPVRDMSSYDARTQEAYVLDAGTYAIKLARNVHDVAEVQTYEVEKTLVYDTDEVTGAPIENRFGYAEGDLTFLSRGDWEGTYPDDSGVSHTASEELLAAIGAYNNPAPSQEQMPATGVDNGILLSDLRGLDYDDPMWDKFLDQFTYQELKQLFSEGGWHSVAIDRLGIPDTRMLDGPAGINSMMVPVSAAAYPTEMMVASTWNEELAYQLGSRIGAEAIAYDVQVWYAPAMNLHRTAQGGRNFEYYSEDPVLSGMMAAATIRGAQEQGVMVTIKHFAMNNEETNARSGIYCWASEQAMRELYLRPFEIAVKEGGATGVMSSFTHIGYKWSGANNELLNGVLRGEWGFVGMVTTDAALAGFMDSALACTNGNDLMLEMGLANSARVVDKAYKLDPVGITLGLRTCAHNLCYSILNYTTAVK